jgi:hypothetical protein
VFEKDYPKFPTPYAKFREIFGLMPFSEDLERLFQPLCKYAFFKSYKCWILGMKVGYRGTRLFSMVPVDTGLMVPDYFQWYQIIFIVV